MKWVRMKAGHYVTERPHTGLVIQRHGRRWLTHRFGRLFGNYTSLRSAQRRARFA